MFVVSLPYAVLNGGYWSLFAMIIVSYICCYTGKILVDCLYEDDNSGISTRQIRVRSSYVHIAKDVWGSRFGARIVNIAQNIELLMTCILYIVLCGDLLLGIFPNTILDHASWCMISCMILFPCAFIKSLKLVSKLSFLNAIVHLIINAIIVIYCLTKVKEWNFTKLQFRINIWSFPISLGIIVFSYTSQIFLPTMEGSMYDRKKFDSMLNVTHFVAAIFKGL
jgi:vesicular inhibitory amino acid transporter